MLTLEKKNDLINIGNVRILIYKDGVELFQMSSDMLEDVMATRNLSKDEACLNMATECSTQLGDETLLEDLENLFIENL